MWRYTKDEKYRDWAWAAVKSIEKHCRCGSGYCGLNDVNRDGTSGTNWHSTQESFFLAETLKYLYVAPRTLTTHRVHGAPQFLTVAHFIGISHFLQTRSCLLKIGSSTPRRTLCPSKKVGLCNINTVLLLSIDSLGPTIGPILLWYHINLIFEPFTGALDREIIFRFTVANQFCRSEVT